MRTRVVLLATAIGLMWALGCSRSPEVQLERHKMRGTEFLQRGKVDEAVLEFQNALRLAPNDADTLFGLGEAYLEKGLPGEAYRAFSRVVEQAPQNLEAHLRLGRLHLLANAPAKARESAEYVLAASPGRAEAYLLLANAYLKEKDLGKALEHYELAVTAAPDALDYRLEHAGALLLGGRTHDARVIIGQILAKEPTHQDALLALAQIAHLQEDTTAADDAFAKALAADPKSSMLWLNYGNYLIKLGKAEEALGAYREAGQLDATGISGWEKLAEVAVATGKLPLAKEAAAAILARRPGSAEGRYYEARILLQEGKPAEAEARLQDVLKQKPDHPEVHYFLALAYRGQDNLRSAKVEATRAVERRPGFYKARMLLAQILVDLRQFEAALKETDGLVVGEKVDSEAVLIRGAALMGLQRMGEAAQIFEALVKAMPQHARAHERLGLSYLGMGDLEKGLAALGRAQEAAPENLTPLAVSASALLARKQHDRAHRLVTAHLERRGESGLSLLLLAQIQASTGKRADARQTVERALALDPRLPEGYLALASLQEGPDAARLALADVDRALAQRPDYLAGWVLKGSLHEALGDRSAANRAYRRVLELSPEFLPALNNLAWNLAEHEGNVDEALKFAQRAVELAPKSAIVNDTLGWLYVKKGVYLKAVSHLEPAAQAAANRPEVHYHLGMAYAGLGETEKAKSSLQRALDLGEGFPGVEEARKTLAQVSAASQ